MAIIGQIISDIFSVMFSMSPETTSILNSILTGFFGFLDTIGKMFTYFIEMMQFITGA